MERYNGNIATKLGISNNKYLAVSNGTYIYDVNKIHAVKEIALDTVALTADQIPQVIAYNEYNQPKTITEDNKELMFFYDYNGQRIKSTYRENNTIKYSRYYFGDYEFTTNGGAIINLSNINNQVNYIHTPAGLKAIFVKERKQSRCLLRCIYRPFGQHT